MEISSEDYSIVYDAERETIVWQGSLHLFGMQQYQPILDLLLQVLDRCSRLILDLSDLEFMNSSGINMLMMFVIKVRDRGDVQLVIQGSNQVLWQTRSLRNLQRLMPKLTIELS